MDEPMVLAVLPEVFRVSYAGSAPLRALLAVMEDLQAPVVTTLDGIERVVDSHLTPTSMTRYLSGWVDLDWLTLLDGEKAPTASEGTVPSPRLRDLIACSADLSARRGTPDGVRRFLELATGVTGFRIEDEPGMFHVRVYVPEAASDQEAIIRRIIEGIKPAHITHEVLIPKEVRSDAGPLRPAEADK